MKEGGKILEVQKIHPLQNHDIVSYIYPYPKRQDHTSLSISITIKCLCTPLLSLIPFIL
jgi:hypothetical protein